MSILITGATGFVGRNLIKYFQQFNIEVLTMPRATLQFVTSADLANVTVVIHLAGKAHDLKTVSNFNEYYGVNYELSKQIYYAFLGSQAEKFIYLSSVKAVADSILTVLTEDTFPNPQTHYGRSKLMAEEYIQSQILPSGKSYFVLRPCMIHGPGNKGNLNLLYKFVQTNLPYPLAAFQNRRSFLTVENLCFIIKEIVERSDINTGIYNVSDDLPLSTNDVVSILATSLKRKPKLWRFPISIIKFVATLGDKLNLQLNTEKLDKLTEDYIISNLKIKEALGKNLPISASEGLFLTAISFNKSSLP